MKHDPTHSFAGLAPVIEPGVGDVPVDRIYLDVPFSEKEQAKARGARWDRQKQSWYVPPGAEIASFHHWLQKAPAGVGKGHESERAERAAASGHAVPACRQYLAVPYGERGPAKAAGAMWDKGKKAWYVGSMADIGKLQRWLPTNCDELQAPVMSPRQEFAEALRSVGCVVEGEHPVMDGSHHRIATDGDKKGERAGFYVGHLDGHPAGYIKNNRTGLDLRWKSKGCAIDPEQKATLAAAAAEKQQVRIADNERRHQQAATRVALQHAQLDQVIQPTPYMAAKGIGVLSGALTDHAGVTTYIAAIDVNGKHWTTQYIHGDGTKRFAKDSRKEGCFHAIGGLDGVAAAPAIVIAEGYATAATLSKALGFATVAAFDSGNLPCVARALHEKFPYKPVVIAGDDDHELETRQGINPGKLKAGEAAKAVGGMMLLPVFAPGEQAGDPGSFTDFNDLAQKSVLGEEAVIRQVGAVVDEVLMSQHERTCCLGDRPVLQTDSH